MTNFVGTARAVLLASVLIVGAGCDKKYPTEEPEPQLSLDAELRSLLGNWGAVPILPVPAQNPALVELGRSLFFDKVLSGNRDISCGTCHEPGVQLGDGLSLSIGTGGTGTAPSRTLGAGRQFVPRNAPSLLNQGLGFFYIFWDGRVNEEGGLARFKTPLGASLPPGLTDLLAAQAMLPVLNRVEMRGERGDLDRFGNVNELAQFGDSSPTLVWAAAMQRLLAIQEYQAKFNAAYPGVPVTALGFQHAANALAAFERAAFTKTGSPFDRYLAGDNRALTEEAKRGAILFFGNARCSTCHSGALLGGQQFANVGVPQLGPGVGKAAPLDIGRGEEFPQTTFYRFAFRVQALRNVELTAPYMHNGAYPTLEAVVRHYSNVDSAQKNYDVTQVAPALRASYRGDDVTKNAVLATLDGRLRLPLRLSPTDQTRLVTFLKSLTDPSARNMSSIVPQSVPSGLAVRE